MSKIKDKAIFERLSGENVPFNSGTEWDGACMPFADNTPKKISCFKCGKLIPQDSDFCPFCQTQLFVICPNCSFRYSAEYPSCYKCGTNRKEYLEQREREREHEQREREQREYEQREREQRERELRERELREECIKEKLERRKRFIFTKELTVKKASYPNAPSGEYILYNKGNVLTSSSHLGNGIITLNESAAYLIEMLKDRTTFTLLDIALLLTDKYDVELSTAIDDAYTLVSSWKNLSILTEADIKEDIQEELERRKRFIFSKELTVKKASYPNAPSDGYILYNKGNVLTSSSHLGNEIIILNERAVYLIEMLKDKTFTLLDIALLLTDKYDVELSTAIGDAYTLVSSWKNLSILTEADIKEDIQEQKERSWVKNYIKSHKYDLAWKDPNIISGVIYNEYIIAHKGRIPERLTLNKIQHYVKVMILQEDANI